MEGDLSLVFLYQGLRRATDYRRDDIPPYVRRESVMNYIVQLAHSQDFRGFVNEIERGLEYGEDTAAIQAALGCMLGD